MTRARVLLPLPDSPTTAVVLQRVRGERDVFEHRHATGAAVARADALDLEQDLSLLGMMHLLLSHLADRQQVPGVLFPRRRDHLPRLADFDRLSVAQHHDAVRDLRDYGQIVADVNGGGVQLPDRILDRGEHLDLGGHVQRGGRLVEDDQIRLARHGHRHHRALELPAGDLMGIAIADVLGIPGDRASCRSACLPFPPGRPPSPRAAPAPRRTVR